MLYSNKENGLLFQLDRLKYISPRILKFLRKPTIYWVNISEDTVSSWPILVSSNMQSINHHKDKDFSAKLSQKCVHSCGWMLPIINWFEFLVRRSKISTQLKKEIWNGWCLLQAGKQITRKTEARWIAHHSLTGSKKQ